VKRILSTPVEGFVFFQGLLDVFEDVFFIKLRQIINSKLNGTLPDEELGL